MDATEFEQKLAEKRSAALAAAEEQPEAPEQPEEPEQPEMPEPPEEQPEAPEEQEQPEAPEQPEEPEEQRDDQGRTVEQARADAVAELPDDATDAEREAAEDAAVEEFYAGRYRDRESVEAALEEKDRYIQQLERERAELRRRGEEQPDQQPQPQQLDVPAWEQWADEQIAEDLEKGALQALQTGGYEGYRIYLSRALQHDDPEIVAAAQVFNNDVMLEVGKLRASAPAQEEQQPDPAADEARRARELIAAKRADYAEIEPLMDAVLEDLPAEDRAWLRREAEQGAEGKARALDFLYLEAKQRQQRKDAAQATERARRRTSAEAATIAATVASAEATPPRTPRSEAEEQVLRIRNDRRRRWGLEEIDA